MSYNIKNQYKYHILYETINNINGKKYIGIHSTNDLNDGYLGSGAKIIEAIKKYGKENFTRTILKFFDSRKQLLEAEKEVVNEAIVNDKKYYNVSLGGMSFIDSLVKLDNVDAFILHQSNAGKKGAKAFYNKLTEKEKNEWHVKGGKSSINPGGYFMSDNGKKNISEARKLSKKYSCPICNSKPLDGGNFNKHLNVVHGIAKEVCYQWRSGAKVDS